MGRGNGLGQRVDDGVHGRAHPALILVNHFPDKQRHIFRIQIQFPDQLVIDLLHLVGPVLVAGVRFTLVQQDAANHPGLLRLLRHRHQMGIRIAAVRPDDVGHPPRRGGRIRRELLLVEQLDLAAGHGHVHHPHLHVLRQTRNQRPAEVIRRPDARMRPRQRRRGSIPLALHAVPVREIDRGQHSEAGIYRSPVLLLDARESLHVRLAKTQVDMKIRIRRIDLNRPRSLHRQRGRDRDPHRQRQCQQSLDASIHVVALPAFRAYYTVNSDSIPLSRTLSRTSSMIRSCVGHVDGDSSSAV